MTYKGKIIIENGGLGMDVKKPLNEFLIKGHDAYIQSKVYRYNILGAHATDY